MVLDYSLLFQFFWRCGGREHGVGSVCSGAVLDYFPEGQVEDMHVVPDAHLFILQFHISSFGTAGREKCAATFFNVALCREAFHRLGSRMLQSLILTDALSSACREKRRK
jgi:hypothetical protein